MSNKQSDIIDIGGIMRRYLKKWHYFAISVVVCGVLGYLFTLTILPKYEIKASIQLNENSSVSAMISGGVSGVTDLLAGNVSGQDEIEIIMSHSVLSEAVHKLGLERMHYKRLRPTVYSMLYKDYPVDILPGDNINLDTLRTTITAKVEMKSSGKIELDMKTADEEIYSSDNLALPAEISTKYGKFNVVTTPHYTSGSTFRNKIIINSAGQVAEELRELLNVGLAAKNSQIINFLFYAENIDYGRDLVNSVIETYLKRAEDMRLRENNALDQLLSDRIALVSSQLAVAEDNVTANLEKSGFAYLSLHGDKGSLMERIAVAEKDYTDRLIQYEMMKMMDEMVKASIKDNSLIPLQGSSEMVSQLISGYNNTLLRRTSMAQSAKPDNVALQRLDEQIDILQRNLMKTIETQVKRTQELMKEYEGIYNNMIAEVGTIPESIQNERTLTRERSILEQTYVFLLKKREETAMIRSQLDPQATIIDSAYALNEDKALSTLVIMTLAIFLGLMIPPVIFFVQRKVRFRKSGQVKKDEPEATPEV